MRTFLALIFVAFLFVGCQCGGTPVAAGPASASPCAAPAMAAQVSHYEIGPVSYAKAGLAIPANLLVCMGNAARCIVDALLPEPIPTAVYAAPAAPAAAPAAPCMVQETYYETEQYQEMVPVMRTRSVPKTRMVPAPPPPPAAPAAGPCASMSDPCVGGCCPVPAPALAGR